VLAFLDHLDPVYRTLPVVDAAHEDIMADSRLQKKTETLR